MQCAVFLIKIVFLCAPLGVIITIITNNINVMRQKLHVGDNRTILDLKPIKRVVFYSLYMFSLFTPPM